MPSDPLPLSPETRAGRAILNDFMTGDGLLNRQPPRGLVVEQVIAIEQEARTLARTLDVDVLARALVGPLEHDLGYMPWDEQKPEGWRWTSLAADIAEAYAAALSRLGERE